VLGLRDVLDEPNAVRAELQPGLFERIAELYDRGFLQRLTIRSPSAAMVDRMRRAGGPTGSAGA
jgi:hypothetical protein